MILDSGICQIYKVKNTARPGEMPNETLVQIAECWYGELSFESSPIQYTENLEQIEIAQRIRILQNRELQEKAVVIIDGQQYKVERLYHGKDIESGELITDMNLSRVVKAYAIE